MTNDELMGAIRSLHGLYYGQLDECESRLFKEARRRGLARVSYEGASGFMGIGKVVVTPVAALNTEQQP